MTAVTRGSRPVTPACWISPFGTTGRNPSSSPMRGSTHRRRRQAVRPRRRDDPAPRRTRCRFRTDQAAQPRNRGLRRARLRPAGRDRARGGRAPRRLHGAPNAAARPRSRSSRPPRRCSELRGRRRPAIPLGREAACPGVGPNRAPYGHRAAPSGAAWSNGTVCSRLARGGLDDGPARTRWCWWRDRASDARTCTIG